MNDYVITSEGCEDLGFTFEANDNDAAIEVAKKSMPGLMNVGNVWNLYEVCRDHPERHNGKDEKGGFYEAFVKQLIVEDDDGTITLAG